MSEGEIEEAKVPGQITISVVWNEQLQTVEALTFDQNQLRNWDMVIAILAVAKGKAELARSQAMQQAFAQEQMKMMEAAKMAQQLSNRGNRPR
jgi:hypothetical protein